MAPGAIPCPDRVPKQRLSVPRISSAMVAALWNFSWTEAGSFRVFVSERIYRRKRRCEAVFEVDSPPPGAAWPKPRLGQVWPPRGSSPSLLLAPGVFWLYRISMTFPDFSEHFHFWTFSVINRNWHCGILLIG